MQEGFAETGNTGLTPAERMALLPHYEILEEIGRGGMGVVYRGRHCDLDIPVAIKVCLDNAGVERFHREAKLLVRSSHLMSSEFATLPVSMPTELYL